MRSSPTFLCIDLKSFYASVECVERGLDPLTARLVVADETRTDKTICLAVSPALKAFGISGRARLFEVKQRLAQVRRETGRTVDFLIAKPRMGRYLQISSDIYETYLQFISPEDIHVYSIDEVFIDITGYLDLYGTTARELAILMIRSVLKRTGITATAGIGTNLYLAKIAMDIVAKHTEADRDGVRIAELDEISFREKLWDHVPLTDFWRIGSRTAARLERYGVHTMGQLARLSLTAEDRLFKEFGVDAEILIDHAWGVETTRMRDIKNYKTSSRSLSSGQVLSKPYPFPKARLVMREMTEQLVLDLVDKGMVAGAFTIDIAYDRESVDSGVYQGPVVADYYGRTVPPSAHGTARLKTPTSSTEEVTSSVMELFDRIVDRRLTVRRLNIAAVQVVPEESVAAQMDMFTDYGRQERERKLQKAMLTIRRKHGNGSVLKGHDLEEGATARERYGQIGGHKA